MNSENQARQGQPYVAERVAHLETAIDYQGQAIAGLRDEMRAGFVRTDAEFVRVHEQLTKIRTTDFRILLSICLTTALGTAGLIVKVYGLLPSP
ncbi:hypothetical protein SAMN05428959_106303 [Duganella sp. CF517]|uniref:hypothetical protein n=1 Tax=Duganella sp. CF517 TaxID=1881038 RepID=UPI0008BB576B|nr:hypothetical protein [Duganella sp. CF517]SEO32239.1 hypothetical protein SAMN05428959_106303 [Duganella sp. CF517]